MSTKIFMKKIQLMLLALLFSLSLPVMAMNLQQAMSGLPTAKSQGLVGEQANGYLGVIQSSTDIELLAKLINEARRTEYSRLARENGITVTDVEAMAGQKAIERTARGHYIQQDGKWIQKR